MFANVLVGVDFRQGGRDAIALAGAARRPRRVDDARRTCIRAGSCRSHAVGPGRRRRGSRARAEASSRGNAPKPSVEARAGRHARSHARAGPARTRGGAWSGPARARQLPSRRVRTGDARRRHARLDRRRTVRGRDRPDRVRRAVRSRSRRSASAYDGSPESKARARAVARELAGVRRAQIHALHVVSLSGYQYVTVGALAADGDQRARQASRTRELKALEGVEGRAAYGAARPRPGRVRRGGRPVGRGLSRLRALGASRPRQHLERAGASHARPAADRSSRRGPGRPRRRRGKRAGGAPGVSRPPGERRREMFDNVLVGVDGRQGGRDAIALAGRLAGARATVTLANVYGGSYMPSHAVVPGRVREDREAAERLLAEELSRLDIDAEIVARQSTSPARGLHELAEARGTDLLVLGSCHRGAVGRATLGDDTRAGLNGAPCALAVAPLGYSADPKPFESIGVAYNATPESELALRRGARARRPDRCTDTRAERRHRSQVRVHRHPPAGRDRRRRTRQSRGGGHGQPRGRRDGGALRRDRPRPGGVQQSGGPAGRRLTLVRPGDAPDRGQHLAPPAQAARARRCSSFRENHGPRRAAHQRSELPPQTRGGLSGRPP